LVTNISLKKEERESDLGENGEISNSKKMYLHKRKNMLSKTVRIWDINSNPAGSR
jgi:hypothetical protein